MYTLNKKFTNPKKGYTGSTGLKRNFRVEKISTEGYM